MTFSSTDSRPSFSSSTSSSLLSSRSSCSRCCSTRTRRRRRSRSLRAMLPACLDSLIFRRKSPASCSSSWACGMRACRASTSSRALAAWVVAASSRSPRSSERSLSASLPESPSGRARAKPRPARLSSKASTPSRTSAEAAAWVRPSFSCCFLTTVPSKLMSWLSRRDFARMFCLHMSVLMAFHSSFAPRFCHRRSRMLNLWISRCSAMRACSRLSSSYATISCFCFS
mmetsp:Transcript_23385/g.66653  ORF Transcript_23385/g.66653 Transcript_23385/m.66653 type:complete len:228 (-) Transcript_23385:712-1395(-)